MRSFEDSWFRAGDGESMFYRHWPARTPEAHGAIVMLHRGHEHSGRVAHLVEELALDDFAFFACDLRGHGRSAGTARHRPGSDRSAGQSVADIECFSRHLQTAHGLASEQIAIVGQSLSAVLAAAWVHDYAPRIRAMVLSAPAFRIRLYVPGARSLLSLALRWRGDFSVNSYVRPRLLTRDPKRIASYASDPLITRAISVRKLLGLDRLARRVVADAQAIRVPTQILVSERDFVVRRRPQQRFFDALGARQKAMETFPALYHDLLGDLERKPAIDAVRAFLLARFAHPCEQSAADTTQSEAFTHEEVSRLAAPLAPWSPRGLYWRSVRAMLATGARLSAGIAVGRRTGFDSGASLDYVYRNQPGGRGMLGRAIDRRYLDAVGWHGIRERKANIEAAIRECVETLRAEGRPVRILDIAAGQARYLFDALPGTSRPDRVELRDHSMLNVIAGRARLAEHGWGEIGTFRRQDAFAPPPVRPRADEPFTLAVVSGFYELYADNQPVRGSLLQLGSELAADGFLIYTGQPWHPQLEFIARALNRERDGAPWVMRRRTQLELDALVAEAGFGKLAQRIDDEGIFSVSVARRVGAQDHAQARGPASRRIRAAEAVR